MTSGAGVAAHHNDEGVLRHHSMQDASYETLETRLGNPPSDIDLLARPEGIATGMVIALVVMLAVVLALGAGGEPARFWDALSVRSLFVQWIALSSAAVLCLARPLLGRVSNTAAALTSYLLLLLTTSVISEIGYRLAPSPQDLFSSGHAGFLFRNLGISAIMSALVLRYLYVQHQWRQQIQAEAQARVQALQARIRPHFLFNSMNTIAALIRTEPDHAEEAVEDLSDLFRASLQEKTRHTLADEIALTRSYLDIERLRRLVAERLALLDVVRDPIEAPPASDPASPDPSGAPC